MLGIPFARIYPIKNERKEFSIDGWKEKLESVKLNWTSIEKLVMASIENYKLMFEMDYVPYNKSYLPNSLDKYFYNPFSKRKILTSLSNATPSLCDHNSPRYWSFSLYGCDATTYTS